MRNLLASAAVTIVLVCLLTSDPVRAAGTKVTLDENGVLAVDGKKTFVLSFSIPPPSDGKTPDGRDAFVELASGGTNFFRIAPRKEEPQGSDAAMTRLRGWLDACAAHGMHCWITLGELPAFKPTGDVAKAQTLRRIITAFKDHPGLGAWKGYDEAAWVKKPAADCQRAYDLFKQLDPNHPVILIHAPTKASLPLEPYMPACDITGVDIYPIAYPPGRHSDFGNREISVVADCTQWSTDAAHGKPVWMTLQVAWGGTASAGKVLRFPTFAQQRYMAYAAIIHGARGLNYQGPALPSTLSARDAQLGWNWTYWQKVMRPLFEEFRPDSPLHPALIAADSKLPIKVDGALDVEFRAREVGDDIFLLAAKREGATVQVKFTGLTSAADGPAPVLFEDPRTVDVKSGTFTDWFGPNDVHIYRFKRSLSQSAP